jgi:two-component system, NarL family, nitrate/nitrite response regulator NarL
MTTERRARVLIADDHPIFRSGLAYEIERRARLELVGQASDGVEAVGLARRLQPDVIVLDLRMPRLGGVPAIESLRTSEVEARILVLSAFTDRQAVYDAMMAGASGYLPKDADREDVCDAIEAIAAGETVIDPSLQGGLVDELRARGGEHVTPLSPRELEVLELTAEGLTSAEIGRRLYIGTSTVKTHLQRAYEKLGVSDRASMVAEAMRRGLID